MDDDKTWLEAHSWVPGTAVGIFFGLAALIAGYIYYKKNKPRKTLDYQITSDILMLRHSGGSGTGPLRVLVGERSVSEPRLIAVRYQNTGNREILSQDFLQAIKLQSDLEVLHLEVRETSGIVITVDMGKIGATTIKSQPTITVDCLNPGEFIDVQYLIDDSRSSVIPSYRVKGATRPAQDVRVARRNRLLFSYLAGAAAVLMLISISVYLADRNLLGPLPIILIALMAAVPTTLTANALGLLREMFSKKDLGERTP